MATQTQTFSLKVKISTARQNKAMERLRKIPGVESASYDAEQGLVTISGDVDPNLLIKQFDNWGRKAELVLEAPRRGLGSPTLASDRQSVKQNIGREHFDFPNDNKDNKGEIKENPDFIWITNPRPKKNGILGFIRKVLELTKIVRQKKSKTEVIKPWQFPHIPKQKQPEEKKNQPPNPMFPQFPPLYGPPRGHPFGQTVMPSQVPHYGSYGGHSMFAQPPMWDSSMQRGLPGGMSFYRPRSPGRMFTPMTRYTRYEDNYY